MGALEQRVDITLQSTTHTRLFSLLKERAKTNAEDMKGAMEIDPSVRTFDPNADSGAMADTKAWERYNEDRQTAVRLAQSGETPTSALAYLNNSANLRFIAYAKTKQHVPDWAGIFLDGNLDPAVKDAYQQDLHDIYWQNRPPIKRAWYHKLAAPAITAGITVAALAGLYFGVIKPDIETEVDEKTRNVETRFNGIEQRMNTEIDNFKETQEQYSIENYLPVIRHEVEDVLQEYRQPNAQEITREILAYVKNNPDEFYESGIPEEFLNRMIENDELMTKLGNRIRDAVFNPRRD